MELNAALGQTPSQFQKVSSSAPPHSKPKANVEDGQEHVAKQLDSGGHAFAGLGARSLAALVGKEGPKIGKQSVTASQLRDAKSRVGGDGIIHPNSWQLYKEPEKVIEFSDEDE